MIVNLVVSFVLFSIFVRAEGLNEILKGQSVLYGVSCLAQNRSNSSQCHKELGSICRDVDERKVWALKALDASGSPGPAFISGNNYWLGSHPQCHDISNRRRFEVNYEKIRHAGPTPHDFPPYPMGFSMVYLRHNNTLQYHFQQPLEFTVQLGLCIPKSCTQDDLRELMQAYVAEKPLTIQHLFDLNLKVTRTKQLEDGGLWMYKLPKMQILVVIFSTILLLNIIGTVYDVKDHNRRKRKRNMVTGHNASVSTIASTKQGLSNGISEVELVSPRNPSLDESRKRSVIGDVLVCFSFYRNCRTLVKTKVSEDSVTVIHGLRFFGMMWVIAVHSIFYQTDYLHNISNGYRLSEDMFSQILSNSTYCVDTYLFISGFLVGYLFLKSKSFKSDKPVNIGAKISEFFMMILNRFLRLTPTYYLLILATDVIYTYYRKTSALDSSELADELCPKYWWRNVLYINNLYPRSEMCMSWSWYLSLDMQFFVVAAFLLILSTITFKTSAALTILLIVGNVIATTYKAYSIGYIPTMDEQLAQLDAIYDLPWNRIGPYLVGVITAYVLLIKMKQKLVLKERTRIILWILFPMLNLWILFTLYTRQLSVEFSAVYMGISRTLWGVGLAWLLIACCTGNARALEKFLAFKGWIPLSRLTYCAYLLNPLMANMMYLGTENSFSASLATFGLATEGVMLSTFQIAFLFSVTCETPFILLTKMAFKKVMASSRRTPLDSQKKQEP